MRKQQPNLRILGNVIFWGLAIPLAYLVSRSNYPLFHSFADMATVFIAASVFVVVWHGRRLLDNHYYLFVGIAFLFFAFLDFMHLLGNKDMGVFPRYGNLGPTLYIASRYVLSISLVLAPLFIKRKLNATFMFAVYALVTLLILLSIFYWRNFPVTFIDGVGLTPFKVISDYIICLILLGAIGWLLINRRAFDYKVLKIIVYSLILSIATGLAFTTYTDPFGITNAVGHFFQIASFYLVYLAFVQTAMTKPQDILYRSLKQSNEEILKLNIELEKVNLDLKQDIAERKQAEEVIKEGKAKLEAVFESMTDAVFISDINGNFVDFNEAFATFHRFKNKEECYRKLAEYPGYIDVYFADGTLLPLDMWAVPRALRGETASNAEYIVRRKDTGETWWGSYSFGPIRGKDGEIIGSVVVGRDVTENKKIEGDLKRYNLELQSANKELEAFSYSVSHDLRAPLRTMDGFSRAVLEDYGDKLDAEGKELLESIRSSSQLMAKLIEALLNLFRIGRAELHTEKVDVSNLAAEVASNLKKTEPSRQIDFVIQPNLAAYGDEQLLKLVFENLIGNALKFTSKRPSARIEFGATKSNGETTFFVKDNGVGFDMAYADKLFKPFQRLHSAQDFAGTGIGLASVQRIIARLGGRVWAQAESDKGATFYFTLAQHLQ